MTWKLKSDEMDAMAESMQGSAFVIPMGISVPDDPRLEAAWKAGKAQREKDGAANRKSCPHKWSGLIRSYWMIGNGG